MVVASGLWARKVLLQQATAQPTRNSSVNRQNKQIYITGSRVHPIHHTLQFHHSAVKNALWARIRGSLTEAMLVDDEVYLLEHGVERIAVIGVRCHFFYKLSRAFMRRNSKREHTEDDGESGRPQTATGSRDKLETVVVTGDDTLRHQTRDGTRWMGVDKPSPPLVGSTCTLFFTVAVPTAKQRKERSKA